METGFRAYVHRVTRPRMSDLAKTIMFLEGKHNKGVQKRKLICPTCKKRPKAQDQGYCRECQRAYTAKWKNRHLP